MGRVETVPIITEVAQEIAPYWENVGTQLGIRNLGRFRTVNNPAEFKFRAMLRKWLGKQTCSEQEMYMAFHEALKHCMLIAAAEKFSQNVASKLNIIIDIN